MCTVHNRLYSTQCTHVQPGPGHLPAPQPQPGLRGEGVREVMRASHPVHLSQVSQPHD